MIALEHTHNNPTLRVFCQTLLDSQHEKGPREHVNRDEPSAIENGFDPGDKHKRGIVNYSR